MTQSAVVSTESLKMSTVTHQAARPAFDAPGVRYHQPSHQSIITHNPLYVTFNIWNVENTSCPVEENISTDVKVDKESDHILLYPFDNLNGAVKLK